LQNGDEQDVQFTVGESTLLALAYWDADFGPEGWDDSTHVQSSSQGWINVNLVSGGPTADRSLDAPEAVITVDDDVSDWAGVAGLSLTLEPIVDRADDELEDKDVTVRMAHDSDNIYMLFTIEDDYDYVADDHNLSAAVAMMFPVDAGSGAHMGADDEEGENSTGMVDIWHWELDCAAGELNGGGAGHPAGEGKDPGNDDVCNMDDEWATDAETREDDNTATPAVAER
jgi:hypothetical protein